jgi:hypothetical protein
MAEKIALAVLLIQADLWYNWATARFPFLLTVEPLPAARNAAAVGRRRWQRPREEVSMPTLYVELPARVSQADVEALGGDLVPYGYADELPPACYDPQVIMLSISFVSDALQGARYWPIGSYARR